MKKMKKSIENIVRHAEVSEKAIERYLADRVKGMGGVCLKYSNANMAGYPDRVVLLPGGVTAWVELKSKGRKPSALQEARFRLMESIGHKVHVCDSREKADEMLEQMKEGGA